MSGHTAAAGSAWRIARFASIESRILDEYVDKQASYFENRDKTGPELIALAFEDLACGVASTRQSAGRLK